MTSVTKVCSFDGCGRKHCARGLCSGHYWQLMYKDKLIPISDRMPTTYERHGMHNSPEWWTWNRMKNRCYNPNSNNYKDYGGRGIAVSERWLHSFKNFYEDMGSKPGKGYSIERINNDGNYEPGNCKWATATEQALNRRLAKREYRLEPKSRSGYFGVYKHPQGWQACLSIGLGVFNTPEEAARVYNEAIIKIRGDRAVLNKIRSAAQ